MTDDGDNGDGDGDGDGNNGILLNYNGTVKQTKAIVMQRRKRRARAGHTPLSQEYRKRCASAEISINLAGLLMQARRA